MSTAPHHDDNNNQDRNHDDERATIENRRPAAGAGSHDPVLANPPQVVAG